MDGNVEADNINWDAFSGAKTIMMRMMCLTGSAMFAHDKMCIILPKSLVRVML